LARILIIDDEPLVRKTIRAALETSHHQISEASDGRIGIQMVASELPDVVITDMLMPEQEGAETISHLRAAYPGTKILAISGGGRVKNTEYLVMAAKLGADEVLAKPFEPAELIEKVSQLCA
jgi:DNA-binding response OmpR family regulator